MNDLLAIAVIRRLVLQLGHQSLPATLCGAHTPLELWICMPQPGLEGLSPMQVLGLPNGEARMLDYLQRRVGAW